MLRIIKRDGSVEEFKKFKISNAILKAMCKGSGIIKENLCIEIANNIYEDYKNEACATVSGVELKVYQYLINYGEKATARAYEDYRAVQAYKREVNTVDETIDTLLKQQDTDITKENSNKNAKVVSTQRDLLAGILSKDYTFRKLIPAHIVQAHNSGVLHWHDADYSIQKMTNCCLVNLEDMLDNGTVINEKLVETPKSFTTACTIATQIMAQVASSQYGGQTISVAHLAKYLRVSYNKEYNKAYKRNVARIADKDLIEQWSREDAEEKMMQELKDGVQTIRYQLSTLQTTNGQSPFATIFLQIIQGDEYEHEMALICEEMLKQRIEGMKNINGQIIGEAFPKLVYLLEEHNCLEGGKYDYITKLGAKCNSLRLVPDYVSKKELMHNYGGVFPPMGCRSFLSPYADENGKQKWWGRFNAGVVSINLPQIGLIAKGDMDLFWRMFNERLELCKEALLARHSLLRGTKSDVAPILWQYGALARLKSGETIDKLLFGGYSTLSLGYVGCYELCVAMLGKSHTTDEGKAFIDAVMLHMKNKCDEWREEYNIGFSLYGTPRAVGA